MAGHDPRKGVETDAQGRDEDAQRSDPEERSFAREAKGIDFSQHYDVGEPDQVSVNAVESQIGAIKRRSEAAHEEVEHARIDATDENGREKLQRAEAKEQQSEAVGSIVISDKIRKEISNRGWTEADIRDIVRTEPAGVSIDNTNGKIGEKGEPASVFGEPKKYVVLNDLSKEVIQISDRKKPNWDDDSRITWYEK